MANSIVDFAESNSYCSGSGSRCGCGSNGGSNNGNSSGCNSGSGNGANGTGGSSSGAGNNGGSGDQNWKINRMAQKCFRAHSVQTLLKV